MGKEIKRYVQKHGESELLTHAYPLWLQMRKLLTDSTDFEGLVHKTSSVKDEKEAKPINEPARNYGTGSIGNLITLEDENIDDDKDCDDWALDEEAAEYRPSKDRNHCHGGNPPPTSRKGAPQ